MTNKSATCFVALATGLMLVPVAASAQQRSPEREATVRIDRMDTDGNGTVSMTEFTNWRTEFVASGRGNETMLEPRRIERAFNQMDADSDGEIEHGELVAFIERNRARQN